MLYEVYDVKARRWVAAPVPRPRAARQVRRPDALPPAQCVALHEAAHCLVAHVHGIAVRWATIGPEGGDTALVVPPLDTAAEVTEYAATIAAGPLMDAQTGAPESGATFDRLQLEILKGRLASVAPEAAWPDPLDLARRAIEGTPGAGAAILALAEQLESRQYLDGQEVRSIIARHVRT